MDIARRIVHIYFKHLNKFIYKELVISMSNLSFKKNQLCDVSQNGKQVNASFKSTNVISTNRHLLLLQMDIFGSSKAMIFSGNYYALIIVYGYWYTWILFLSHKKDTFYAFRILSKFIQNKKGLSIVTI